MGQYNEESEEVRNREQHVAFNENITIHGKTVFHPLDNVFLPAKHS